MGYLQLVSGSWAGATQDCDATPLLVGGKVRLGRLMLTENAEAELARLVAIKSVRVKRFIT
jgi:hypothetical protein